MKAKIIKKGTPVLLRQKEILQGSVIKSGPFMHNKRLCVKLVGFRSAIPVRLVEVV